MSNPTPHADGRWRFIVLAVLLTLLGLGLRFHRLNAQPLWTDEVYSIQVARSPLDEISRRSAQVNNSLPTYFLLLRAVVGLDETNLDYRARWPSALAGSLSIPLFIGLVYLWRREEKVALLAGLLLALNPLHLWYSQEARAYALMLLCGLLVWLFFELALSTRRMVWWWLYWLAAIAAVAFHKTALFFPVACALWQAWQVGRGQEARRGLLHQMPVAILFLGVMALPSHPPPEGYGRGASVLEIGYTFLAFVGGYSFGPSVSEIQSLGPSAAVAQNLPQVGLMLAVLTLVGLAGVLARRDMWPGRELSFLVFTIGAVWVYAMFSGFAFNVRYVLAGLLAFLALLAVLAAGSHSTKLARLAVTGVVGLSLWADAQWFYQPIYGKADVRGLARWLTDNQSGIRTWTVLPQYLQQNLDWYLQSSPEVRNGGLPATGERTTTFPPLPDVLIIGRRHHIADPDQIIAAYQAQAGVIVTNRSFTGLELYVRRPVP